jgi:hypothetical protein
MASAIHAKKRIQIFEGKQIGTLKIEYRISDTECRMTMLNLFSRFLRRSLFSLRPARYARKQT